MLFKFKKGKINLDVITDRKELIDLYPVDHVKNFIPNWYKKMPSLCEDEIKDSPTMKSCMGIIDLFKKGIVIPNWSDFIIYKDHENQQIKFEYADQITQVMFHSPKQWKYYLDEKESLHFKTTSPWCFKCKEDIKFFFTGFHWGLNPFLIHIPSAIVDFKYQHQTHINAFMRHMFFNKIMIPAGQALIHLIPLSDKEIDLKYHLEDTKTINNLWTGMTLHFTNNYTKLVNNLRQRRNK